jgi:TctA family transporter
MSQKFNSITGSFVTRLEILVFGILMSGMVLNLSLATERLEGLHPNKFGKGVTGLRLTFIPVELLLVVYSGMMGWLIYRAWKIRSPIFTRIVVGMFGLTTIASVLMILF